MLPELDLVNDASLQQLCLKHGVSRLSLFGSVLRNDFNPDKSDVAGTQHLPRNAHRHHFETRHLLQFIEVGDCHGLAIDRRLRALIEEWQHRHAVELWKRIMKLRLDNPIRESRAAAAEAA